MQAREQALQACIPEYICHGFMKNDWIGGIKRFENCPVSEMKKLVDDGLIDVDDNQNDSPTAGEFIAIMERFPTLTAHGYIVSEERPDCRTTIEGLAGVVQESDLAEVRKLLSHADEWSGCS